MQGVVVLGATGSIGDSTLDVIARHPDKYRVVALSAHSNAEKLLALCLQFFPQQAVLVEEGKSQWLRAELKAAGSQTELLTGAKALEDIAAHPDARQVMAAIVGAAGLLPTLAAVRAGKRVLLANKEALVMSGELFMDEVARHGAELLPIDSEHNAIFQSLPFACQQGDHYRHHGVSQILLTGSGGPFRTRDLASFGAITPAQAVAHPNWSMGQKISVDSATMMNKGLEFIEARWLFDCAVDDIQVVLHPQSIIHSMVRYSDGSVLAQMGNPDMRTPIAHAMAYPERIDAGVEPLDFFSLGQFSFDQPDPARYPCLYLAINACRLGQGATTVLNAANEVAVDAFLKGRLPFTGIAGLVEQSLDTLAHKTARDLRSILELDQEARHYAERLLPC
ncbi:1-deoxy-D-xylulose-5-phosphate reductoisomerase [Gallaecimonas xiamenensis]|uniref:1-deoxy-D-xylulose 5-phosphate reductoisomerase n=1 Tax=Gallaecimonas xiamenensis 3-C-1 TaxID=745411 RepID=K2J2Z7_9GAMM|nr:1-deoxy-D-xylulose-5-phosphate reductoisomerase [Gallaecimonas xiamenensis]EKE69207.1 1-deoxy-D-xylulose 5-phosphate reductoisomerase [Gallaecimonas xiamenensis 3-C-1]